MTAYNRNVLQQIVMDDVAQKMQMGRAAIAMGNGLDPNTYVRPFPVSSNTTINITSPAQDTQGAAQPAATPPTTETPDQPPVTQPRTPAESRESVATNDPLAGVHNANSSTNAPSWVKWAAAALIGSALPLGGIAAYKAFTQPETGAKVHIFWGDKEITPGNSATATVTEGSK